MYWGYVWSNKSGVASGVQADTNATARHELAEFYDSEMRTANGNAYLKLVLAKDSGYSTFQARVYLKYKTAAENPYNSSSQYHTLYYSPGGLTGWHELKIARNYGNYWKVYVDGTVKDWYVQWPYYSESYGRTYAEAQYNSGSILAQFLNHTNDFWTLVSGIWNRNDGSPMPSFGSTSPYYIDFLYLLRLDGDAMILGQLSMSAIKWGVSTLCQTFSH